MLRSCHISGTMTSFSGCFYALAIVLLSHSSRGSLFFLSNWDIFHSLICPVCWLDVFFLGGGGCWGWGLCVLSGATSVILSASVSPVIFLSLYLNLLIMHLSKCCFVCHHSLSLSLSLSSFVSLFSVSLFVCLWDWLSVCLTIYLPLVVSFSSLFDSLSLSQSLCNCLFSHY